MDRIEITMPLPPKEMHPNVRKHWRAKLNCKKLQREEAHIRALSVMRSQLRWKLAEVETTWYLARRNDQDNLLAWGKATWDGLADAEIVDNDRGFIFLPPQQVTGKEAKGARKLVIVITRRE